MQNPSQIYNILRYNLKTKLGIVCRKFKNNNMQIRKIVQKLSWKKYWKTLFCGKRILNFRHCYLYLNVFTSNTFSTTLSLEIFLSDQLNNILKESNIVETKQKDIYVVHYVVILNIFGPLKNTLENTYWFIFSENRPNQCNQHITCNT